MRQLVLLMTLLAALAASTPQATAQNSASEFDIQAQIPRRGDFIAFGFDAVWMMHNHTLVRVDVSDNSVVDIEIPGARGPYRGMAVGEGGVWIPDTRTGLISKVDPVSLQVAFAIPVQLYSPEGSIGIGEGSVWVNSIADGKSLLMRYAASDGTEQARIQMPLGDAVTIGFGSAWVTDGVKNKVYRIDTATNSLVAEIPCSKGPRFLAAGYGSVWVIALSDGVIDRIDPETNSVVATIVTGGHAGGDITTGGEYVWATYHGSLPLVQIDPQNNAVRTFEGRGFGDSVAFGAGSVWISGSKINRIAPPVWR